MKRALVKSFDLYTRNCFHNASKFNPARNPSLPLLSASNPSRFSSHSSESDSTRKPNASSGNDDIISKEELKKRIEKLNEGDLEALPSIFEGILERKLVGINDDELLEGLKAPKRGPKELLESDSDNDFDDDSDHDFDDDDADKLEETDEQNSSR
ncbi:hypothetical protein K2173_028261 [Erythroxylum novogranatense]|uniref:Uncharacterized protein n=1 Tax=Erythroxylum novogranatense TaxID=1862640 RepID=A0AAV8U4P2_9ROSI|nr:hypothetical protein K2173_028261 [Erythroxylum novogranatense]